MPRDLSGNYTLPGVNPVAGGTIIDINWANPTMNDIAIQLNNVFTRDGLLGPLAPFKIVDGSIAAPGLAFNSELGLGIYRESAGVLGIAANGGAIAKFTPGGVIFIKPLNVDRVLLGEGNASLPSTGFTLEQNTGIFRAATGQFAVSVLGVAKTWVHAGGFTVSGETLTDTLRSLGVANLNGDVNVTGLLTGAGANFVNSVNAGGISTPSFLADPNATIANLFIGYPTAAGLFQRSGANVINLRVGDHTGGVFYNYTFNQTELTLPGSVRTTKVIVQGGPYNPLADPASSALHASGAFGGGLILDAAANGFVSMFLVAGGTAQLRCFGTGDYTYQFTSTGDAYAKLQYGLSSPNHYVRIGWDAADSSVYMVHGSNNSRLSLDAGGNFVFAINGALRGFFGPVGGLYLVYPTGTWPVPKVMAGAVTTGAGGTAVVNFSQSFASPSVIFSIENNTGGQFLTQMMNRSATSFTVRVVDMSGIPSVGIVVNWIAVERTQ